MNTLIPREPQADQRPPPPQRLVPHPILQGRRRERRPRQEARLREARQE